MSATYPVSATPGSVTTARNRVWVGDFRDGSLWRLDPVRGDLQRFTTTGEPRDLTSLGGYVYVAGDGETMFDSTVTRYDAVTGSRQAGVRLLACSVAAGDGVLWAAGCPNIDRLSTGPGRFHRLAERFVPFRRPLSAETNRFTMRDMAVGEGSLWVIGDAVDRRVFRVDERSGTILGTTLLSFAPRSIAAGEGAVWVTGPMDDVIARLDPADGHRQQIIRVARGASGVAVGVGAVWVASALDHVVSRIDPASGQVVAQVPIERLPARGHRRCGRRLGDRRCRVAALSSSSPLPSPYSPQRSPAAAPTSRSSGSGFSPTAKGRSAASGTASSPARSFRSSAAVPVFSARARAAG